MLTCKILLLYYSQSAQNLYINCILYVILIYFSEKLYTQSRVTKISPYLCSYYAKCKIFLLGSHCIPSGVAREDREQNATVCTLSLHPLSLTSSCMPSVESSYFLRDLHIVSSILCSRRSTEVSSCHLYHYLLLHKY